MTRDTDTTLLSSCPRDCYDGCGILIRKRGDRIVSVRGNPDHPVNRGTLCGKCSVSYNGIWQDPDARLQHPLRRTGPKGSRRFERVDWATALDLIADVLRPVIAAGDGKTVLHTHYSGTLSLLAFMFPQRFFHKLGATEVDPDSICNLAGHAAWNTLFGSSIVGFDPRTAADTACTVIWGANPATSAPHMFKHWVRELHGPVIVVDPIATDTAAAAQLHLKPRPGSDAALAYSLLNALETADALDREFIESHTLGFEEIEGFIADASPEWGERHTGVPADDIRRAAQLYASGPALLWAGQGLQRQPRGGNVMRAVGLLPALTGNVGKPGAGFYYLNVTPVIAGARLGRLAGAHLADQIPDPVSHMGLAGRLEDPDEFKVLFVWNTNPLASAPEQERLRAALARTDLFTVVVDCFQTDTADYADIVLPAASFLEFDDLTFGYMNLCIGAQQRAVPPMGESRTNMQIFRDLARAVGFDDPDLHTGDLELIDALLGEMALGVDFDALKHRGFQMLGEKPLTFYDDLKFRTPSGRIEIASDAAESMGLSRLPRPDPPDDPPSGTFRLLTPASAWRLNDSFANDPGTARQAGRATVHVHPDDAARLGIASGDRVRLANETGQLELEASVDESMQPGVLVSHKGRWPRLEPSGTNVNVLHAGLSADVSGASAVHGTVVRLTTVG